MQMTRGLRIVLVWPWLLHGIFGTAAPPNALHTYCEDEVFDARCDLGQVIMMQVARYGRMRLGQCLDSNFGYMGCSTDVRDKFDVLCSGRQRCEVEVRDLVDIKPCPKDLRGYLEATYTCVTIMSPNMERCGPNNLPTIHSSNGFIASFTTSQTGCGGIDSPWLIQAKPGQKVNLTLYDFSAHRATHKFGDAQVCQVLAVIKEKGRGGSETVCGGQQRVHHVYTSITNEVEIRSVFKRNSEKNNRHFLIQFQVSGCPDLRVSQSTSFNRNSDGSAVVQCQTGEKWNVLCQDGVWTGEWHNCTGDSPIAGESVGAVMTLLPLPYGLSVMIMVAIAVIIGIMVLVFGLVYIRRRKAQRAAPPVVNPSGKDYYTAPRGEYPEHDPYRHPLPGSENAYYRTWELHHQTNGSTTHAHGHPPSYESTSGGDNIYSGYTEHIYESPKSVRKEYEAKFGDPTSAQYFELDPSAVQFQNGGSGTNGRVGLH